LKCCRYRHGRRVRCKKYKKYWRICKIKLGHKKKYIFNVFLITIKKKLKKRCWWKGKLHKAHWNCKKSHHHPKKLKCCKVKHHKVIKCKLYKKYWKICKYKHGKKKFCWWRARLIGFRKHKKWMKHHHHHHHKKHRHRLTINNFSKKYLYLKFL